MISTLINYKDIPSNGVLPKGRPCILVDTETNEVIYPLTISNSNIVIPGGDSDSIPPPQ